MTDLYAYGYRTATPDNPQTWPNQWLTFEELETKDKWNRLHPEVRRRLKALFDDARRAGKTLGCGGGWRSAAQQEATFRSRYQPGYDDDAKSRVYWDTDPDGPRWWSIKSNNLAPSTPPGRSYHEECREVDDGDPDAAWAYACDTIGDWAWMRELVDDGTGRMVKRIALYGLVEFDDVNDEPWHAQPVELPTARRNYSGQRLGVWPLPGAKPTPEPTPDPLEVEDTDMQLIDKDYGKPTWARVAIAGGRLKWIRGKADALVNRLVAGKKIPGPEQASHDEFVDLMRTIGTEGPSPFDAAQPGSVPDAALDGEWKRAARN